MEQLTKIALAGTSKAGAALAGVTAHPADVLLSGYKAAEVEEELLLRAGLQAVFQQAGQVGAHGVAAVEPAPPDSTPCGSARLTGLLQNAFATDSKELLIEFICQMAGSGLSLPYELLPQALNTTDAKVREHLLPVLGERGRWLSTFHANWSWVESGVAVLSGRDRDALEREWEWGTIPQRCHVLATLRRADADEARRWLEPILSTEKPDHRARLLATFEHGLTTADEAFLESCLDDRSGQVKEVAVGLLARLPESALAGRMRERADAMLNVETRGRIRKQLKLVCEPPEKIDKAWQRDGVAAKPPRGKGKRAYWAETVLSTVPPAYWSSKFQTPAAALVDAAEDDPFEVDVLAGWTRAVIRFSTAESATSNWLIPLWKFWTGRAERLNGQGRAAALEQLAMLIPAMSLSDAESCVLEQLQAAQKNHDSEALSMLALLPRPWNAKFSHKYLNLVRDVLKSSSDNHSYQWANTLFTAAKAIPREVFASALTPWEVKSAEKSMWFAQSAEREAARFCDLIRARQSFYTEVAREGG